MTTEQLIGHAIRRTLQSSRMMPADAPMQAAYSEYFGRAMVCNDPRTPILSFGEWISAGQPAGPFTNG